MDLYPAAAIDNLTRTLAFDTVTSLYKDLDSNIERCKKVPEN
jgi:hypothetical protein